MYNFLLYLDFLFVAMGTSIKMHSGFEGRRCAPLKLYMVIENQLECEDCTAGQYWANFIKACKPCSSHYYTNLKRNIRRSCKDYARPVSTTPHAGLKLTESFFLLTVLAELPTEITNRNNTVSPPKNTPPREVLHDNFYSTEEKAPGVTDAVNYFTETVRGTEEENIEKEADNVKYRVPEGVFLICFAALAVVFVLAISTLLVLYKYGYVQCKKK